MGSVVPRTSVNAAARSSAFRATDISTLISSLLSRVRGAAHTRYIYISTYLHYLHIYTMRLLLAALLAAVATGHEYFPGQCPNFAPMAGFEWDKVSCANMLEKYFPIHRTIFVLVPVLLRHLVRDAQVLHEVLLPHLRVQD